ncbi:uncharacterized protein E5676_scaffold832G00370 [Cucumis melo var. makuwa]|uniref:Retrotransposon gag domain-containing protein n=1 Tax=Cucumis melo var. makuwa TaxID=1194695 RepID=A0A5D3CPR5_CUCMM|nr:uncharacterized protein E5676_scaffold832G00370 [Cucumis melo var. makuwa]
MAKFIIETADCKNPLWVFKIWKPLMKKKRTSSHAKEKEEGTDDRDKSYIITQFTEGVEMEENTILKTDCSLPNTEKYEGGKISSKISRGSQRQESPDGRVETQIGCIGLRCCQGNRKVAEYAKEFHCLSARTRTNESENYQIAKFVDGLKEDIHEQVDLQPIATLLAAISMAFKAEMKLEKRQKNNGTKKNKWDKTFTPYQRKNYDNVRQVQGFGTSKAKEQSSKANQSPRTQEISNKKSSSTNYPRPKWNFATGATKRDTYPINAHNGKR